MFTKSADFYDIIYGLKNYAAASQKLTEIVRSESPAAAQSVLDVGCGTGRHLEHLKEYFDFVEGTDIEEGLLEVARARLPDVNFRRGDMVDVSMGRKYDAVVCLFSAIGYVVTLDRMRAAIANMVRHLNPGGVIVVEPWFAPDRYWIDTITANHAETPDLKVAWMYNSRRDGNVSVLDIHYLVGTRDDVVHFVEPHRMGLFSNEQYIQAFEDAGLTATYDPEGLFSRGLFVGRLLS